MIFDVMEMHPNTLGEALREWFFVPDDPRQDYHGGHYNYKVRSDAIPFSDRLCRLYNEQYVEDEYINVQGWTARADNNGHTVTAILYWDGDGTLIFIIKKNLKTIRVIQNTDCKKNYWEDC